MKKKTAVQDIIADATAWAIIESKSKARTSLGKTRAIARYLGGRDLTTEYFNHLHDIAPTEMLADLRHSAEVTRERKELRAIPVFARYHLAKITEVSKYYESRSGTRDLESWLSNALAKAAYVYIFDVRNPRLRKIYKGENTIEAGLRTETNGKYGWDCVSWHYADYCGILSRDGRTLYYDAGAGALTSPITPNGTVRIAGKIYRRPTPPTKTTLRPHHLRRLYEGAIRGRGVQWLWNIKEKAGMYIHIATGEVYHTPAEAEKLPPTVVFREAVRAFQERKREKIATAKREAVRSFLAENSQKIYVGIEDSVSAGNCRTQTEQYAAQLYAHLRVDGPCCVAASIILADRDDAYTQRACMQAAQRHIAV